MKAIILARVSTEEQKEAGNSLPAQQARLRAYIDRKSDFQLVKEFIFDESAYQDKERKKFQQVVDYISNQKETIAVCCDKVDRLSRDFLLGLPALEKLRRIGKIELHFPSDNLVIHKDSPATDLFHYNIALSLAQYFSNAISDNVKRAIEQKLRNGEWPGKAPYGYKNISISEDKKDIIVDEFTSRVVKKMYEWYSTGAYSLLIIRKKLKEDHNIDFSKGYIDAILKNPFYCGLMRFKGDLYPHKYEPLISKELFDKVQQIKAGYNKKHHKFAGLPYAYRGLIRCAVCGCMITPEKHKGHIYYHCTQYKGKHKMEWLREEDITEQFAQLFKKLQIPQEILEDITNSLKSVHKGKIEYREEEFKALNAEKNKYAKRIEHSYEDRLDGRITVNEYDKYHTEFRNKINEIDSKLANLQKAEDDYYLSAKYLLELANRASDLFKSSEIEERRQLLKLTLQNLTLDGKKVRFQAQKPFDTILNFADSPSWLPR
ncbi:MAG TPA: recombinase family protein [Patescibacteria group bacterium]